MYSSLQPFSNQTGSRNRTRNRADVLHSITSNGFPYSRRLSAHTSCVNALTFSSGNSRFLASGGDDHRIHLWDFHQEDLKTPAMTMVGIRGIILTLAFSATNQYLYSGGTDSVIYQYDSSHMDAPISAIGNLSPKQSFREHREHVRAITCHPFQDQIFMSASEDGTIRRYDSRSSNRAARAQDTMQLMSEVTGVQYHPIMDNIFVTSDNKGQVCLRDERMAFGPLTQRSGQGVVQLYNTKLTKQSIGHLSNPESSSVVFDREGKKIAVTMLNYLPTIYALSDPNPVAICSGRNLPDGSPNPPGERTYSNSCTMKHGTFGGPGLDTDEYYVAGSDDFRGYIWKIPPLSELIERREELTADNWLTHDFRQTIAFTQSLEGNKFVPVELPTPACRLTGHMSIVNTAIFHSSYLHVVTSGIEKDIILHSPTPSSPCTQDLSLSPSVRRLGENATEDRVAYLQALTTSRPDTLTRDDEAEQTTLSMFDHILRQEGEADVFLVRKWRDSSAPDSDDSADDDSSDSSDTTSL
ncbi:WD40 repeat-like protein [Crucibulum laeve]|uniref:WD40 repeat-like protein n=1 Tax=Crucibulum laeve TaxID=68775 RepID=A0A5C3M7V1_9AGAR|nr:WD40 repeat-like protein [Crucibulum laeve]